MVDTNQVKTPTPPVWVSIMQQHGFEWTSFFILLARCSERTAQLVRAALHAVIRTVLVSGQTGKLHHFVTLTHNKNEIVAYNILTKKQLFIQLPQTADKNLESELLGKFRIFFPSPPSFFFLYKKTTFPVTKIVQLNTVIYLPLNVKPLHYLAQYSNMKYTSYCICVKYTSVNTKWCIQHSWNETKKLLIRFDLHKDFSSIDMFLWNTFQLNFLVFK